MKKLIMILAISLVACHNAVESDLHESHKSSEQENFATALTLNNGEKWKSDERTKINVGALLNLLNDSVYVDEAKRSDLVLTMQTRIDTMIKECTMKGPEHEALHKWLALILQDMKKLKADDNEYRHVREALKNDIENFYVYFE